jgi:hypothetical protein
LSEHWIFGMCVPTGPGKWNETNPILPQMAMWKTWVLDSPSEFRSPPPPAYDSPNKAAELAEIKNFPRTPKTNAAAYFWEYAVGGLRGHQYWAEQMGRLVLEYRLDDDPPLAARAYALQNIASIDAGIACWDSKYTYWAIRPFQLDPEVTPLFPTPNHPSYSRRAWLPLDGRGSDSRVFVPARRRNACSARRRGPRVACLGGHPLSQRHRRRCRARSGGSRQGDRPGAKRRFVVAWRLARRAPDPAGLPDLLGTSRSTCSSVGVRLRRTALGTL